ncbi:hypothetical protein ONZ45_g13915 [Pleurotus djamor]|nr:hypothetical protein ONZ45_g13915 [Pleurotus djamor]
MRRHNGPTEEDEHQHQHDNCHPGKVHRHHPEHPPLRYLNRLSPPYGTSFFRFQTFTPINGPISDMLWNYLNLWNIDAYVYVVRALPGEDFVANGGSVYVALVHGGSARAGNPVGPSLEYRYSMFRQNATEAFTFSAQYENSIDYHKGEQTGLVQGNGVQWATRLKTSIGFGANFPFGGFSLFRHDGLDPISFECTASVYQHQEESEWPMGPTFKASRTATINIDIPLSRYDPLNRRRESKL